MAKTSIIRIRIIALAMVLMAATIVSRLFFIQIVRGDYYQGQADRQYLSAGGDLFDRGSIFFKTKDGQEISAASLKTGFLLAIDPTQISVSERDQVFQSLSKVAPLDYQTFIKKASRTEDPYEELANRLDPVAAETIEQMKLPGVSLYKERWRFYPGGSLAAHAIGLLGFQGDEYLGRYGLERQYEDILVRTGSDSFVNFFAEIFTGLGQSVFAVDDGAAQGDIVLTIEPAVQTILEQELSEVVETWQVSSAGGIVMNPQTGEILAMAAWPNFDPGAKQSDVGALNNPLVQNTYEMGSIIKPLTMAAALDAGVVTPNTTYDDKGFLLLNSKRIANFDGRGRGVVPMQEVLNQSLNTGVVFAMQRLGHEKFKKYFYDFGLAEKTGIDLPVEAMGQLKNLDSKRDIEYATAAFGQGIATTPIATVRALASLGNGGVLVAPHLVKEIKYTTRLTKKIEPAAGRRVLSEETSKTISRMLVKVVDEALINGKAKMERYSVAAKTGTAQIANPNGGGYYDDRYMHTFFGYFPAFDPQFIVFLYAREPVGAKYSSETLTKPFTGLTKFLLNYYQVPPDR